MRFVTPFGREPVPGELFHFGVEYDAVDSGGGPILVHAWIAEEALAELQCPDPPCHDLYLEVPADANDTELRLVAQNQSGDRVMLVLPIGKPRPHPHLFATA